YLPRLRRLRLSRPVHHQHGPRPLLRRFGRPTARRRPLPLPPRRPGPPPIPLRHLALLWSGTAHARCRLAAHVPPPPAEHARRACCAWLGGCRPPPPVAPCRRSFPRRPPAYELSVHRRLPLARSALISCWSPFSRSERSDAAGYSGSRFASPR